MKMYKVVLAAGAGTVIEWFDFYLFGALAATVLGPLFFPSNDSFVSTLLALATFAVAFVARPIGGIVFGHLGDRIGRKRTLVATLFLMGGGTFLIGVLPTYEQWGVAAPILLVVLRIAQGLGLGGEFAGATLLTVEHSEKTGRRGFYGAWTLAASPIGFILAAGVIALVTALAGEEGLQSWAWRIPFLCSAILLVVGFYVRRKIEEAPAFKAMAQSHDSTRMPLFELLRSYPRPFLISILASLGIFVGFYTVTTFGVSYAKGDVGLGTDFVMLATIGGQVLYFCGILIGGVLSDRIGRRWPMIVGLLSFGAWSFAFYPLVATGSTPAVLVSFGVMFLCLGVMYGPMAAFLSELFSTEVRYTGVSLGYQLAGALVGGISPLIALTMLDTFGSTVPVSAYAAIAACVSAAAVFVTGETSSRPLNTDEMSGEPDTLTTEIAATSGREPLGNDAR
jgi:MFS family permease